MKKIISIVLVAMLLMSSVISAGAYDPYPPKLFEDKFVEQHMTNYDGVVEDYYYDELYYHYDENRQVDWALVSAHSMMEQPMPINQVICDRVLMSSSWSVPFSFGYAVYDVKNDCFVEISENMLSYYDGLKDYWESLKVGKLIGDTDSDGELTILDATYIQRALAMLCDFAENDKVQGYGFSGTLKYISDFDRDGDRTVLDATAIQRKLAGLDVVDTGKFVFYNQDKHSLFGDIPDVSDEAVKIEFSSEYELSQFSNAMYDYEVAGDYCTYAIIKSNEQYNMLFNDKAPKFDDEFFDSKWLVVSIVECSDLLTEAPITKLGKVDDTLFVSAFPYRTNPDLPAPEAMQMWLSIVSVDKEQVIDVNNIMHGRM